MAPRCLWSALNRFRLGGLLRRLGRCSGFDVGPKLALERVDDHSIARVYLPAEHHPRQLVLDQPLNHEEVLETGRRVMGQFIGLIRAVLPRIAAELVQG